MKLLLMILLGIPMLAKADNCETSISWRRLVVGGEMQNNTWTKDNPGIYSNRLKNDGDCSKPAGKIGLNRAEYEQKAHNDREEYAAKKKAEQDYYNQRKEQREREKLLRALKKPGNGYGDKNHIHIGPRGKLYDDKSIRAKETGKGKEEKNGQGLHRVPQQEANKHSPKPH